MYLNLVGGYIIRMQDLTRHDEGDFILNEANMFFLSNYDLSDRAKRHPFEACLLNGIDFVQEANIVWIRKIEKDHL